MPTDPGKSWPKDTGKIWPIDTGKTQPIEKEPVLATLPPLTAIQRREANEQIALLAHEDFDVRELASKRLTEAGPRALALLQPALKSPDPEVRLRASELVARSVTPRLDVERFIDDPFALAVVSFPHLQTQLKQVETLVKSPEKVNQRKAEIGTMLEMADKGVLPLGVQEIQALEKEKRILQNLNTWKLYFLIDGMKRINLGDGDRKTAAEYLLEYHNTVKQLSYNPFGQNTLASTIAQHKLDRDPDFMRKLKPLLQQHDLESLLRKAKEKEDELSDPNR